MQQLRGLDTAAPGGSAGGSGAYHAHHPLSPCGMGIDLDNISRYTPLHIDASSPRCLPLPDALRHPRRLLASHSSPPAPRHPPSDRHGPPPRHPRSPPAPRPITPFALPLAASSMLPAIDPMPWSLPPPTPPSHASIHGRDFVASTHCLRRLPFVLREARRCSEVEWRIAGVDSTSAASTEVPHRCVRVRDGAVDTGRGDASIWRGRGTCGSGRLRSGCA
ncbi:hypothetical protein B0H14DRAFT_177369 [Mycena olivaceomarginata]|nr:hypothetical protein B0H14DRAFT_177369 [Mycena olivaceomarginata]